MSRDKAATHHAIRARVTHYLVASLLSLFFVAPIAFMFVAAVKPSADALVDMGSWRAFLPVPFTLDNFGTAWTQANAGRLLLNSTIIIVAIVVLSLVVNSAFGYALARMRFRGRRLLLLVVLALLVVPFQAIAIPLLFLSAQVGWLNTYAVQIFPSVASPFFVYMFYTFFLDQPKELEEAARIDGAGPLRTFVSVSAPLARPAYGAMAILAFLFNWGELLWPVMVTRGVEVRPLPMGLATFQTLPPLDWGAIMAFASIMTVPVLVVFLAFQRSFVEGVAYQGIKG